MARKRVFLALAMSVAAVLLVASSAAATPSWMNLGGAISGMSVTAVAVDQANGVVYAGMEENGVWRCENPLTAPSWADTVMPPGGVNVQSLAYDAVHGELYAGTSSSVWRCDNPRTAPVWTDLGGGVTDSMIVYDQVHDVIYATSGTIWRCANPRTAPTWTDTLGPNTNTRRLAYDGIHNKLYAGLAMGGVWRCDNPDTAAVWSDTHGGAGGTDPVNDLAYDATRNVLYSASSQSLSTHSGEGVSRCANPDTAPTWTLLNFGSGNVSEVACDEANDVVFAGDFGLFSTVESGNGRGVYKIDNPDTSPTWVNTGEAIADHGVGDLAFDGTRNLLYAANGAGVWRYGEAKTTTFYFAEGTCRPDFDTYICIQNPGGSEAQVLITYMKGDGTSLIQNVAVAPSSRATVSARATVGTGDDVAHDFSARVECTNGQSIVAERPMYFNFNAGGSGQAGMEAKQPGGDQGTSKGAGDQLGWTGGHDVVGATAPASVFYFAEGTCRPNFEPFICIQNPGSAPADVTITYLKGDGTAVPQTLVVGPNSRSTVGVQGVLGTGDDTAHDFSARVESTNGQPIIAERPMYFNYNGVWDGGHDVLGALTAAKSFYFAEGTCRPNFDPYICVLNTDLWDAQVKVTYMKGDGTTATRELTVGASSRSTVIVRDTLGTGDDTAHDFSAKVESTNGPLIVAERPMYFNYNGILTGGHDVVGSITPQETYFFAEGTCRPDFDPYFCIQNPTTMAAGVTITYMKGNATTQTQTLTVAPNSRSTVGVRGVLGTGDDAAHDFSAKVECTSGQPIIVERPMYFNYNRVWTGGHDVIGF